MARKKSAALAAPSNIEEATALLGRYAEISAHIEEMKASANLSITAIQAERDAFIKPLEEQLKTLFTQARAWWAVAGETLTEGKRKSTEIAGCEIGVRMSNPALKLPKGVTAPALIPLLRPGCGDAFIRTKEELNRAAMITALRWVTPGRDPADTAEYATWCGAELLRDELTRLGLSVNQQDEFYIDCAKTEPAPADPLILAPEGDA
jgi:phage host-nuclease inhibitor protein Gam